MTVALPDVQQAPGVAVNFLASISVGIRRGPEPRGRAAKILDVRLERTKPPFSENGGNTRSVEGRIEFIPAGR
jgi:hypothetical protein